MAVEQARRLTTVEIDLDSGSAQPAADFAAVVGMGWPAATSAAELGAQLLARVLPAERAALSETVQAIVRGAQGTSGVVACTVVDDTGVSRRVECAWFLAPGEGGRRLSLACGVAAPTTADEARWRESERRYRAALHAGRMGSWETDFENHARLWSPEGQALFGLDVPGGRGRVGGPDDEFRRALHPDDRHLADRYREIADRQDTFEADYRIVRPDGRVAWLSGRGLVVARMPDGRARRLVSIMADITGRREAEAQLRVERERLALALEAGGMGAFDLDIAADTLWWSPGMYTVFGVSPETFVPTRESVVDLVHPDDRAGFVRGRKLAIAERRPFVHEFRALREDGRIAWVAHLGHIECDAEGRPRRTYGVSMDVTGRRLQEEALREADRQKDRFIATLAHELRNPLAPIRNAVELLRRSSGGDAHLAATHEVIDRQVRQMALLLDDLLDVSRVTQGRIRLRRTTVTLRGVLEHAVAQVFSNLLVNAAKYTPREGHIVVEARRDGTEALVIVADDGVGITAEQMPRLFRMFGQDEQGLERAQSGLGIGLWLARALVGLHGGVIDAASAGRGSGSEFRVRLPLVAGPPAGVTPERTATSRATPLRVLVADDKADLADSLAELLRLEGHIVYVAYGGDEALEAARSFRPQAVVLDLGMPGRDGYEVCRALRAEPWGGTIRLIAQTGWGLPDHVRRSREAGFDHHVVKPVDPLELMALLQRR
jgi:PAS domain S-box-containing protein